LPFRAREGLNIRFLRYDVDGEFPAADVSTLVQEELKVKKQNRVAIMADDNHAFDALRKFDLEWLDPREDYYWSGWKVQRKLRKPAKRVIAGRYDHWFQWYMRTQRLRAFHSIVLIDPFSSITDQEYGGYLDGLFARLLGKVRQVVIVYRPDNLALPVGDEEGRTKEVLRALLYGTRLSKRELFEQARLAFVSISEDLLSKSLQGLGLHIWGSQTRYQLDSYNENLLQGMVPQAPSRSEEGEPGRFEPLFKREKRFRAEARIPGKMLSQCALEDVEKHGWVTVPFEAAKLSEWLHQLNNEGDSRLRAIYEGMENPSHDQWGALLNPPRNDVRRILDAFSQEGKLERREWNREVGRPAIAYTLPGMAPFSDRRCGQCAFYVPAKRRCSLWWLANKTNPFFHPRWKRPDSAVTTFEIHKMKYASRIGPHSSACLRFLDKKRDHIRKIVPERCEVCGQVIPRGAKTMVTCPNCKTRYVPWRGKVMVLTAYEHEFNRIYREVTGGEAKHDLEEWRRRVKESLADRRAMFGFEDADDLFAEEPSAAAPEPPHKWPAYDQTLQDGVDRLARTTDIATQLSMAMARSALNATRRMVNFGKIYRGDWEPLIARQEAYLTLITRADRPKLLPYEALVMKQYWICYGLALRGALEWVGPRKRSRFVAEFVEDPSGRARGYSPVDAAINYLHQRRLRQAERINLDVGFSGRCDGFLHRERYNSRKIGLLLDMIDPFKFADREELLLVVLDRGLTWKDFKIEADRRGSNFYYPSPSATAKLNQAGSDADNIVVGYRGINQGLSEAYRTFAASTLEVIEAPDKHQKLEPFVYAPA